MIYAVLIALLTAALFVLLLPLWKNPDMPKPLRRRIVACIAAVFYIGSLGLYALLGAPGIVPLIEEHNKQLASLQESIAAQSREIQASPKDLGAWVGLGQSLMATGQYKSAAGAFRRAVVLSGGNPLLLLAYASALISDAGGKVTDDARQTLQMVLLQQPENPEARYLLAVRLLQEGKTEAAMKNMKELYHSLPDNSPMKAVIDRQIGRK